MEPRSRGSRRPGRRRAVAVWVALILATLAAGPSPSVASPAPGAPSAGAARRASGTPATTAVPATYLELAEQGIARAERAWRDRRRGWYDERLHDHARYPLATIWGIVPLFEAIDATDIAAPSRSHRAAVVSFAKGAERYLDATLGHTPGYAPYPGDRGRVQAWFDDNGWWGLAFLDAYRATGSARYLGDAERAFRFIADQGWDAAGGGLWWNTSHPYRSGEALASGSLLGALLYADTHRPSYLTQVERFLSWGDENFLTEDGLYDLTENNHTPTPYVEGTMVEAHQVLCEAGQTEACARASELANACWARFQARIDMGPQFDTIYLHWMLIYAGQTGDSRWPTLAGTLASEAETEAVEPLSGLYLRAWDGTSITEHEAEPEMLQTDAATVELFAWLAAVHS